MKEREVNNSRELLGLEQVNLMIKKSILRWFGHVECEDATNGINKTLYDVGN